MFNKNISRLDFKKIVLTKSAARGDTKEYEVLKLRDGMVATMYSGSWLYNESVKREDCRIGHGSWGESQYKSFAEDLAKLRVQTWDGFDKANKHALDGWSFDLLIEKAEGGTIKAHGTNSYPKNYREFEELLEVQVFGPKEY